jgi:hypothetical protein
MRSERAGAGPWWVMSFEHDGWRVTIKFKVAPAGYPDTIRLMTLEGSGQPPGSQALARVMIAAARTWCEQHRDGIFDAWSLARRDPGAGEARP